VTPPAGIVNHPSWKPADKRLQCPLCLKLHDTETTYDQDFLAHDPNADQAYRWLSARSYISHATERGWPPAGELV
jgi:hypothetical protein